MRALCGGTPSVIAYGDATFPKGTAFCGGGKVSCTSKRRPLGGAGCERSEQTEGVFPAVHGYDPTCENGVQKRPQAFLYPEI